MMTATMANKLKSSNSNASSEKERAVSNVHESDIAAGQVRMKRCMSVPYEQEFKSILKCKTVDESLHNTTRSEPADIGRPSFNRSISFGNIGIREYARTLGDNPSCSSGPPVRYVLYGATTYVLAFALPCSHHQNSSFTTIISIAWEYKALKEMPVEDYEENRPARRTQMEMVLPRKLRSEMLKKDWAITQRQIAEAVRRNVKIKNQRRTTVNNLGKASKMEQMFESFARKIKRTLLFQKSVSKQVKELEAKHNEAQRIRKQRMLNLQMADEYDTETRSARSGTSNPNNMVEEKTASIDDSPMEEPEDDPVPVPITVSEQDI